MITIQAIVSSTILFGRRENMSVETKTTILRLLRSITFPRSSSAVLATIVWACQEICQLSDKQLVLMFSEMTSNEITRNFAYTCYLMPETCAQIYTSFGNESRAKSCMELHLLDHVHTLLKKARADRSFTFTSQTVQTKNKTTGSDKTGKKEKGKLKPGRKKLTRVQPSSIERNTSISQSSPDEGPFLETQITDACGKINFDEIAENISVVDEAAVKDDPDLIDIKIEPIDPELDPDYGGLIHDTTFESKVETTESFEVKTEAISPTPDIVPQLIDHSYSFILKSQCKDDINDWMSSTWSVRTSGWKYGCDNGIDDEDDQQLNITVRVQCDPKPLANKLYIPIVRVSRVSLPADYVMSDLDEDDDDDEMDENLYSNLKEYEESIAGMITSDMSPDEFHARQSYVQRRRQPAALEHERVLAMKYIRELRSNKRREESLICRICKTKTFTATATLMYHYRSHAGIKPFVCLICNTTFTRQHSLNYHMLIHNNLNRFTCKDCGRMFRHPSHFKEHLRRHTGETPFHCSDCPLKFKTRNTYKRHLRTRHGKLLVANGVHVMPHDEFMRVRTKPYLFEQKMRELNDASETTEVEPVIVKQEPVEVVEEPPVVAPTPTPVVMTMPAILRRAPAILSRKSVPTVAI